MNTRSEPLRIDVVSDVMCPWCTIGYGQLKKALDEAGTDYQLNWHPFELNPNMPKEGQNLREHVAEKYGTTPEQSAQSRQSMTALGKEVGFDFQFSDDMRMHNTFQTHQLLHWSKEFGRMHDLKQALFTAHFTHRRNLSDMEVLADIAGEIGLDREEAIAILKDDRFASVVRQEEAFWLQQGIQGVPAVIFDRKHLVTGAQGVDNYASILKQLEEMRM